MNITEIICSVPYSTVFNIASPVDYTLLHTIRYKLSDLAIAVHTPMQVTVHFDSLVYHALVLGTSLLFSGPPR